MPKAPAGITRAAVGLIGVSLVLAACSGDRARDCDCGEPPLDQDLPPAAPSEPVVTEARRSEPTPGPTAVETAEAGPRLRILGIAQDGGLPHVACSCVRCEAARHDPNRASPVASVAAIAPGGVVWIVDATPDLAVQLDALADVRGPSEARVDRSPISGLLLTHAHMGHYVGLAQLGFEAASTEAIPVHASPRMVEFLTTNAPWDQLVRLANIAPRPAAPGQRVELGGGLWAEPLVVPHRGEYTDTYAYYLGGPNKRALYIPDTDPWAKWERDLDEVFADVDLVLVDGTFYSGDELPGRDTTQIGHPLMTDTMDRLEPRLEPRLGDGLEVWFIHLNHSNPTLDPSSAERRALEARGFVVAEVGREYSL